MRILVINWQDWTHPRAGGAEIHLREVFGRIAAAGHRVDLLCTGFDGAASEERLDGINVIRRGHRWELFNFAVPGIYRRVLRRNRYDVVVDDLNKVPFYSPLFSDRPVVALVHHFFGGTVFEQTNPAFGSYVWMSGQRYEGDWVHDKPQGQGKMRFANGNQYEGQLAAGLPQGRGRMVFPGGDVYEGQFEAGKAHGEGKYAWKSGERYEGAWSRGLKHGAGIFHWPTGDRWEGVFKDDERTDDGHIVRKGS